MSEKPTKDHPIVFGTQQFLDHQKIFWGITMLTHPRLMPQFWIQFTAFTITILSSIYYVPLVIKIPMPIIVWIFVQYHHIFSHLYSFDSLLYTLYMLHIVLSHQRNNSSCPPKTPLWRMPLQLETLIPPMMWLLGKVIPINVLCWLLLDPYLHCLYGLQLQARAVVNISNHLYRICTKVQWHLQIIK